MARFTRGTASEPRRRSRCTPQPRSALIPLCHLAQAQDGYLTREAMEEIGELCGVTATEVYGTATFYEMLFTEPVGKHVIAICTNIACMLEGAYELYGARRGDARHSRR